MKGMERYCLEHLAFVNPLWNSGPNGCRLTGEDENNAPLSGFFWDWRGSVVLFCSWCYLALWRSASFVPRHE